MASINIIIKRELKKGGSGWGGFFVSIVLNVHGLGIDAGQVLTCAQLLLCLCVCVWWGGGGGEDRR